MVSVARVVSEHQHALGYVRSKYTPSALQYTPEVSRSDEFWMQSSGNFGRAEAPLPEEYVGQCGEEGE